MVVRVVEVVVAAAVAILSFLGMIFNDLCYVNVE